MSTIQLENEILSARECEVLELMARGHKNCEIVLALKIEVRTVQFHVGNILAKLGVKNRTRVGIFILSWVLLGLVGSL